MFSWVKFISVVFFIFLAGSLGPGYVAASQAPEISVYPGSLNFGQTIGPSSPVPKQFIVSNKGSGNLLLIGVEIAEEEIPSAPSLDGELFSQSHNCSVVAPGEYCIINVSFDAASPGVKNATLKIYSNDPKKPVSTHALWGRGEGNFQDRLGTEKGKGRPPKVIIPSTTKLLDPSTLEKLTASPDLLSLSSKRLFLAFRESTPLLESLAPNDVIVSGVTDATPYGLLRKVISISRRNGQVIVETGPATLAEAIQQGKATHFSKLGAKHIRSIVPLTGKISPEVTPFSDLGGVIELPVHFEFENEFGEKVEFTGKVTFGSQFDLNMTVSLSFFDFKLRDFSFFNTTDVFLSLEVFAGSVFEFKKEIEVGRIHFQPITFMIGPVPVVIFPELIVKVGVDGQLFAGMTAEVTAGAAVTSAAVYHEGYWWTFSYFDPDFSFTEPKVGGGAKLTASAGPQLNLKFYGIAGPYVRLKGYGELSIDSNKVPWWVFYGGVKVLLGVEVEILGENLVDKEWELIDWRKIIDQGGAFSACLSGYVQTC